MKQAQSITEQLKAESQLEWVQRLNNINVKGREQSLPLAFCL
ncbi:MAG: TnpV protein [Lachnospiraceae bacterium]|nr:TnpV protein [Lachnospiraceae bacterium]